LERVLRSIVTIGGQFEVQHVALQNILGDVQQANILFGQLKELAIESPKTFMELTSYAKQLSAYQIPANELYDTTKRLADMSSGLGVDMNRLILAYGQVRSAAVLRGQELRQFTEAGIPMVQALADKFTQLNGKLTTTADVFKFISARAVPFEMVKEVLWDMTSQGGQFFNMQEELANTLYGKWQKLQDSWQIMLGSIAEGTSASGFLFKQVLDFAVLLTQNLDKMVLALSASALTARNSVAICSQFQEHVHSNYLETPVQHICRTQPHSHLGVFR
jgi:tape measure domain-containing protein